MASGSVLGAIREKLLTDATFAPRIPGGVHANELPASKALSLPAVVLRLVKTEFEFLTRAAQPNTAEYAAYQVEKPLVELWVECEDAAQGEVVLRDAQRVLLDQSLPLSAGTAFMAHPEDLFLAPQTGRSARGEPQYSWCMPLRVWFTREV